MLDAFTSPRSVAIVGAARSEGKVGHIVFDNLISSGFPGPVYPVNPSAREIHGHRCYPSVADLPETVDLAVLVVPAAAVPESAEDCADAGVRSLVVISAGFKETGPEGAALERSLTEVAERHGVRFLGPNCLGVISTGSRLNASFATGMPPAGNISFMSQSGALGTAILDWASGEGMGLAHFVSLGNKADLSETDFVAAWVKDASTAVVMGYLESVSDGEGFVTSSSLLTATKPFIVLKSGGSDAGARAVSSHTGSLAGSEDAYDAAFRKAGIIRARSAQELFDLATGFSLQPLPAGPGTAILTNAGGPAIMATDAVEAHGLSLASLGRATTEALRAILPPAAALYNPVDVLGDADAERYEEAARLLYADDDVRSLLVMLTPQAMTQPDETARRLAALAGESGTTTVACFMGRGAVADAQTILREAGVPAYSFPEGAVATIAAMERYRDHLGRRAHEPPSFVVDKVVPGAIIDRAKAFRRNFITEEAAADVVASYGVQVPKGGTARDLSSAKALAADIGYPVVLKVASPDILHKSDVGGIVVGITDEAELERAYEQVMTRTRSYMPDAVVWGVTVQKMVTGGREIIIGVNRDPTFGPLLLFGLGGIYVEVLKDVAFRLCPVSEEEARRMVGEIRSFGLLRGARGQRPADIDAVVDAIVRISALVTDFDDMLELDVNPLLVMDKGAGAFAADVRIGIGG